MDVPEPLLLSFFPDLLWRLDACELTDIGPRYRRAIDDEDLLMVTYYLAADFFWNCRSVFVDDPIVDMLRKTVAADATPPPIDWACRRESGTISFEKVINR